MRNQLTRIALVTVVVTAAVAGCAPTETVVSDAELATVMQLREQSLDELAVSFGLPPQGEVPLVRWTTNEDAAATWVDCLKESGFAVALNAPDGLDFGDVPPEQNQSGGPLDQAFWLCQAQYTQDPRIGRERTDAEKGRIYDYLTGTLTDCLEGEGYTVDDPPSRSTYVSTFYSGVQWSPYDSVPAADMNAELFSKCRQSAPFADIYGAPLPQPGD